MAVAWIERRLIASTLRPDRTDMGGSWRLWQDVRRGAVLAAAAAEIAPTWNTPCICAVQCH
ncbi:MAG: hypothetical protein P3W94_006080 [Paracoccus sp. (in: a-proteobacteria)]|nr:hypothetical protein [Paracoccus sp. (in: a-proteobacteria)]